MNLQDQINAVAADLADFKLAVTEELRDLRRTDVREVTFGCDDPELFDKLAAWRRQEADRQGVPAYRIFGNRVLTAIANVKPNDRYELLNIKGVGQNKTDLYGEAVLSIIHAW